MKKKIEFFKNIIYYVYDKITIKNPCLKNCGFLLENIRCRNLKALYAHRHFTGGFNERILYDR